MRHVIIGAGDVGKGLYEVILKSGQNVVLIDKDSNENGPFEIMHVCFPYSARFVDYVNDYIVKFQPSLVINHATVPPGTTESIKLVPAVHSPVRGRHPSMARDMKIYAKYVAGGDYIRAASVLEDCGFRVKTFKDSKITELGKLLENIRWGLNLAFSQEQERMCKHYGVPYKDVVNDFETDCNEGRKEIGRDKICMPVLYPGFIGGHCIMPNVNILLEEYPSQFLKIIQDSNERFSNGV